MVLPAVAIETVKKVRGGFPDSKVTQLGIGMQPIVVTRIRKRFAWQGSASGCGGLSSGFSDRA